MIDPPSKIWIPDEQAASEEAFSSFASEAESLVECLPEGGACEIIDIDRNGDASRSPSKKGGICLGRTSSIESSLCLTVGQNPPQGCSLLKIRGA
jgi:hypothetical protein